MSTGYSLKDTTTQLTSLSWLIEHGFTVTIEADPNNHTLKACAFMAACKGTIHRAITSKMLSPEYDISLTAEVQSVLSMLETEVQRP